MSTSRRQLLAMTGLSCLSLGLAACGRQTAAPAAGGSVSLQVATNDPNYATYFSGWAAKLSKTPGRFRYRTSSLIEAPDQVVTKLLTSSMSHSRLPDLPGLEITQFSRLQRQDIARYLLVDLAKAVPGLRERFYPARLAPYTSQGAVYGLESDMCLGVYFYREDLFAKYRLPTDFGSWDELISIGAAANRSHGISLGAVGNNDITWMAMMLLQQGGEFFGTDGSLRLESSEAVSALQTLVRGVRTGAFALFNDFFGAAAASALNQDKIAGYFMPDWFAPFVLRLNAPQQKGRWRMRRLPRFPRGGPTSVWGGTGFGVAKDQRNTQAALELLTAAYATTEGQVQRFLTAHYLPTMKAAWKDPRLLAYEDDYLGGQRPFELFGDIVAQAPTMVTGPYWDVMSSQLAVALSDALRGKTSPADAVRSAASSIRTQMKAV
ncbi:ABC transporter substrate-binding protein [Streptomyces sp. CA-111067]|uniref:ABC transporter substrate-binding protein n=1 Tax=Streptomyces sp. CA-111067 TaxID=3240046 RepID=UPI003D96FC0A